MEEIEEEIVINNAYRRFYSKLLKVLPVKDIVQNFFSRKLLSNSHKSQIDCYSDQKNKRKYFLDEVIYPSIQVGVADLFKEMLALMRRSDDMVARGVAGKISKELYPSCFSSMGMCLICQRVLCSYQC